MGATLTDNKAKLDNIDKAIKEALERKRRIIVQGKEIAYDTLVRLYGKEGQELIDAVTAEHGLIQSENHVQPRFSGKPFRYCETAHHS